ncbi:MAG TPA: FHA domain-containing protein [Burkholderiaceae bacterium]
MKNTASGEENVLFGRHIVGRLSESNTILSCADSSPIHAIISWSNGLWRIKDMSARGVFINGIKIPPASECRIRQGDEFRFGSENGVAWTLLNEEPPHSMLIPMSSHLPAIALSSEVIALPPADRPSAVLSKSRYGYWICESPEKTYELKSGDLVGDRDNQWQFVDWNFLDGWDGLKEPNIAQQKEEEHLSFLFNVSQDEEHVSLTIQAGAKKLALGERSHHYLLLVLARAKLANKMLGIAAEEQGWILTSELSKMLGLSERHINIQIHRIRKQLIGLFPAYFSEHDVIERRSGALRIVGNSMLIHGGLKQKA